MDKKIKHLEMIQNIISRMANCSFLIKGWSIAIISAIFLLSSKEAERFFVILAYFPAIAFWILDGFYLWQEKLYRGLYEAVRNKNEDAIDFSMDTSFITNITWVEAMLSKTIIIFHGVIVLGIALIMLIS